MALLNPSIPSLIDWDHSLVTDWEANAQYGLGRNWELANSWLIANAPSLAIADLIANNVYIHQSIISLDPSLSRPRIYAGVYWLYKTVIQPSVTRIQDRISQLNQNNQNPLNVRIDAIRIENRPGQKNPAELRPVRHNGVVTYVLIINIAAYINYINTFSEGFPPALQQQYANDHHFNPADFLDLHEAVHSMSAVAVEDYYLSHSNIIPLIAAEAAAEFLNYADIARSWGTLYAQPFAYTIEHAFFNQYFGYYYNSQWGGDFDDMIEAANRVAASIVEGTYDNKIFKLLYLAAISSIAANLGISNIKVYMLLNALRVNSNDEFQLVVQATEIFQQYLAQGWSINDLLYNIGRIVSIYSHGS